LTATRSGLGFDLHPLVDGRPLILGGVTVPAEKGLGGHSDADVLTHAVCEALLGALALGDLGRMFPDSDPRWKGVSSLVLLEGVMAAITRKGARLVNVDVTAERLAGTMKVAAEQVSVKAKSPEHLGLLGRGEGIAAMAVASVEVS